MVEELLREGTDWMLAMRPVWAYVLVLAVAYGENVVPPIPGDLIVVFGGYLAGVGKLHLGMVILLSSLGGAFGFMTMYAVGYRIGDAVFDPHRLRWLPKRRIGQARDWIKRYGYGVVAANRFLSGARSVISLTVGMAHMNGWRTALFASVSALIWCSIISYAGYALGENWRVVGAYLQRYGTVILVLLGVLIIFQGVRLYRKRKRNSGVDGRKGEL